MVHHRLVWLGNYALNLGDHNIKAVVGYTYEKSIWEQIVGSNNDFSFDNTKYCEICIRDRVQTMEPTLTGMD